LVAGLRAHEAWSTDQHADLTETIAAQILAAWEQAVEDPYPPASALLDRVYAAGA
jgi:TPP-dependent pyruvate/acetoin dehydrogenase alpha subunit